MDWSGGRSRRCWVHPIEWRRNAIEKWHIGSGQHAMARGLRRNGLYLNSTSRGAYDTTESQSRETRVQRRGSGRVGPQLTDDAELADQPERAQLAWSILFGSIARARLSLSFVAPGVGEGMLSLDDPRWKEVG